MLLYLSIWHFLSNSSAVEQMAVNHLAEGSNPSWGGLYVLLFTRVNSG